MVRLALAGGEALGLAWVLDGLEVTLIGSIGGLLERPDTLALSATEVGWIGSLYIGGALLGALMFGRIADKLGRKKLFMLTLSVYILATLATAFSTGFVLLTIYRFVTGLGIGGEYATINSAIDELIHARVPGHVNLAINASCWLGAALGGSVEPGVARSASSGSGARMARLFPAGRGTGALDCIGASSCAGKSVLAAEAWQAARSGKYSRGD